MRGCHWGTCSKGQSPMRLSKHSGRAAALQPKDPEPHISAALLLEKQKDYADAEKEYQAVLSL